MDNFSYKSTLIVHFNASRDEILWRGNEVYTWIFQSKIGTKMGILIELQAKLES